MKRIISSVSALALILSLFPAFANIHAAASETVSPTVSGYVSAVGGDIEIASKTKTPKIYVDSSDYEGVVLAANDLSADIEAVTGAKPEIINSLDTSEGGTGVVLGNAPKLITGTTIENGKGIIAVYKGSGTLSSVQFSENYSDGVFTFEKAVNLSQGETVKGMVWSNDDKQTPLTPVYGEFTSKTNSSADIVIGTIGKSVAIDDLISSGKLDVADVEGEWEAFTLQSVDGKLVIAGADKRGTMYGIYDLSEKMGVSPWEWWADVTPQHSDAIYVTLPSGGYTQGAPAVKYRGIFINQEYNLWNWSKSLATEGETGMNTATYDKIFHLMARLGSNYMWPAMHEYSPAFNNNPLNAQNADKYGIAMGGSHCEMLLRNNMGELLDFQTKWIAEHPDAELYMFKDGSLGKDVAYDYTDIDKEGKTVDNKQFLEDYWRERIKTNGKYENVYTVGMRGVHDGQWNPVVPSEYTTTKEKNQYKIDLLEEIITKQREILSEEIGKPASEIPQVFIPYKEILDLYNASVDNPLEIPEDITIMWTNDNFGHIRQGSTEAEMARSGGGGMYYHVSYHGKPTDVIWTAGTQLGLI
ncbi:MAG: glycosyl hydrolase 115 family protein, partial [Clostridia bacterium]|nr:glycosyl hydrolase 115 family protein [Clostridia bacterium]